MGVQTADMRESARGGSSFRRLPLAVLDRASASGQKRLCVLLSYSTSTKLTLIAVAKELEYRNAERTCSIVLTAGLSLPGFG